MNNAWRNADAIKQRKWVLSHVLVVIWMIVIFCFSAQIGEESSDLSGGLCHFCASIINKVFGFGWNDTTVLEMAELISYPVRKIAHMTEFGILAVFIYNALGFYEQFSLPPKHYLAAWLLTVCYACTDEFHQLFVPERSGNFFDVGVDATGALLALVCLYIAKKIYVKFRKR